MCPTPFSSVALSFNGCSQVGERAIYCNVDFTQKIFHVFPLYFIWIV